MSLMELKMLGKGIFPIEWKKLLNVVRTRKTTFFASGFGFTLLVCSILLVFTNPNPVNQGQSWIPSMFGSSSTRSRTFFTFFFPNSDNSSQAENSPVQDPQREHHESAVDNMDGISNTSGAQESPPDIISSRDFLDSGAKVDKTTEDPRKYPDGTLVETIPDNGKNKNRTQERENPSTGSVPVNYSDPDSVNKTTYPVSAHDKPLEALSRNSSVEPVLGSNVTEAKGAEISNGTKSEEAVKKKKKKCDIFYGRWVPDHTKPLYPAGSCPYIDESFNCFRNRRPDHDYEKWRWQPNDCDIPRFNAIDMLERLRGKRLSYVGDSLNRNMWESMVCSLRHVVPDKKKVHEISGRKEFRTEGFYSFRYEDYNCSVDFIRAPFLVQEWEVDEGNGSKKETLRLDRMDTSASKFKDADIVVFNTGHWWTHEKTSKGKDYYQEGDHIYSELNVLEAYRKALKTWAKWVDRHINPNRTIVYFRGYSATHFSGGQWNSGGQCHKESEPIYNETYLTKYNPKMLVLESVMQEMKTPVNYLNITRITDYRKDAHPSIYRKQYLSQEDRIQSTQYQDCSHWCLPGVPDTWNELLYASLLLTGKGTWST